YSTWINPIIGMVDASASATDFRTQVVASPYRVFQGPLVARQGFNPSDLSRLTVPQFDQFGGFDRGFGGSPVITSQTRADVDSIRGAIWPRTLIFQFLLTGLALWGAQRIIQVPRVPSRGLLRRRRANAS
ncbi:MAG: hypothetical protein HKN91_00650, partial [Acidimicrobiia bacterium]|nr:hypothetical protein [Acidimicrobiia bacterium]